MDVFSHGVDVFSHGVDVLSVLLQGDAVELKLIVGGRYVSGRRQPLVLTRS
jgi:hypothetical protein